MVGNCLNGNKQPRYFTVGFVRDTAALRRKRATTTLHGRFCSGHGASRDGIQPPRNFHGMVLTGHGNHGNVWTGRKPRGRPSRYFTFMFCTGNGHHDASTVLFIREPAIAALPRISVTQNSDRGLISLHLWYVLRERSAYDGDGVDESCSFIEWLNFCETIFF